MNLREKTLIIIGVTLAGLVTILYAASQTIIMSSFVELEEQTARQDVKRVLNALSNDLAAMNSTTYDWAAWNDTYAFIENKNSDYIESNLMDSTFTTLNLNIMMFVHSSGKIIFEKAVDLEEGVEILFPRSLEHHISLKDYLIRHSDVESYITGILLLPEGPLLVVSRPVLTSNDEGPIRGTLIMGRYLNNAECEHLAEVTQVPITVYRIDSAMPSDFETACTILKDTSIFIQPLSEETVAGYTVLNDIYKNPALILRTDAPRSIYKQGQASMHYFILSLLVAGVVFGVVIIVLLESQVLFRLMYLSQRISTIGERDDLSQRITMTGKDELSTLADTINQMIETIEQSHKRLEESVKEKEVLLKEIHHRVKNNMQIISSLLNLQSAHTKDKTLRKMFEEAQNRIRSMRLIHEKLYQSKELGHIDFKEYLKALTTDLVRSFGVNTDNIAIVIIAENILLDIDTAIPCGLIINELVSNSLKYAFPDGRKGEIMVALEPVEGSIELRVADNGVGIPEGLDIKNTRSLGLRLVTILAEDQLQGSITLKRDYGTEFCITF